MPASSTPGRILSANSAACRATSSGGVLGDQLQLGSRRELVGAASGKPGLQPPMQPRDAHHEELVEVACEDGEELDSFEQGDALILGERQHPGVEVEPGQLAIEVAVFG